MTSTAWSAIQKRLDSMPKPTQTLHLCADPDVRDRYQTAKQAAARAEDYEKSLGKDAEKDALALVRKQVREAQAELKAATEAYEAATEALLGAADRLVAVWDGEGGEAGGTGSVVKLAQENGVAVDVVWPRGAVRA